MFLFLWSTMIHTIMREVFLNSILTYQSINDISDVFIAPKVIQSKFHWNFLSSCTLTCLTCLCFLTYTTVTYNDHRTSNKIIVLYIMAVNFMKNSKTEIVFSGSYPPYQADVDCKVNADAHGRNQENCRNCTELDAEYTHHS